MLKIYAFILVKGSRSLNDVPKVLKLPKICYFSTLHQSQKPFEPENIWRKKYGKQGECFSLDLPTSSTSKHHNGKRLKKFVVFSSFEK